MQFFLENWAALILGIMALLKVIVNLTPSDKDNQIFAYLDTIVNAIVPDRRKRRK